jgi:hypothetical protein
VNINTKCLSLTLVGILAASSYASATLFLSDSFVTLPAGTEDKNAGEYRLNNGLTNDNNKDVTGGSIIGFAAANPWGGNSGNPRTVDFGLSSPSLVGSGGSVEFRGGNDTTNRYVHRAISSYTDPGTIYFTGTLQASLLDDDAISLIGFSSIAADTRAIAMLNNSGDFYNGLAFGFKGDGAGGMDLIVRYRDGNLNYVDSIVLAGVSADVSYTVVGRIDWNDPLSAGGTRDPFSIWVNPQSVTEPSTDFSALGFLGDPGALGAVYLMQRSFGTGLSDAVYMDEVRVGASWNDLSIIPEPSSSAMLLGVAAFILIGMRRFRNR